MVSKYPMNNKAKALPNGKGSPDYRGLPKTPKGVPATKPKPYSKPLPPLKGPAFTAARRAAGLHPLGRAFNLGWDIGQAIWDAGLGDAVQPIISKWLFPSTYWTTTYCEGCAGGGYYRASTATCCETFSTIGGPSPGLNQISWSTTTITKRVWQLYKTWPREGTNQYWNQRTGAMSPKASAPSPTPATGWTVATPEPVPAHWPVAVPSVQPQVQPRPRPAQKPRPNEEPAKEQKPGPNKNPKPVYDLPVFPFPVVGIPTEESGVIFQPPTVVGTPTGGRGRNSKLKIRTKKGNPRQKKPPRKTKQVKPNIVAIGGKLWVALNALTEGGDFIEYMWDALPDQYKRKWIYEARWENEKPGWWKADMQSKMEDLYHHLGHVDVAKAVMGYINNEIEDRVYAAMGIPTKKLAQQLGVATGVDAAISDAMSWAMKEVRDKNGKVIKEGASFSDIIPTVDFDPETGIVTLTLAGHEKQVSLGDKVF